MFLIFLNFNLLSSRSQRSVEFDVRWSWMLSSYVGDYSLFFSVSSFLFCCFSFYNAMEI